MKFLIRSTKNIPEDESTSKGNFHVLKNVARVSLGLSINTRPSSLWETLLCQCSLCFSGIKDSFLLFIFIHFFLDWSWSRLTLLHSECNSRCCRVRNGSRLQTANFKNDGKIFLYYPLTYAAIFFPWKIKFLPLDLHKLRFKRNDIR